MNWTLETTTTGPLEPGRFVFLDTTHSADEPAGELESSIVDAVRDAATGLVAAIGNSGEAVSLTINAHETLDGEGFRPAHVTITVSRLSPDREAEPAQ